MAGNDKPTDYQQVVVDSEDSDYSEEESDYSDGSGDSSDEIARDYELFRTETTRQLFELFKETVELKEVIAKKDAEIANLTEKIKTVKLVIGLNDKVGITAVETKTADSEIKQVSVLSDQQSRRIENLVSQLDTKDSEIADLRSTIVDKNKSIKKYKSILNRLTEKVDDLTNELGSVIEQIIEPKIESGGMAVPMPSSFQEQDD